MPLQSELMDAKSLYLTPNADACTGQYLEHILHSPGPRAGDPH
jgi:hypothetical protein